MENLIIIRQLPVIEERLKTLSDKIDQDIELALSLAVTEESIKEVKKMRAELSAGFKDLERERIDVKKKIEKPYKAFEDVYKHYVADKYREADGILKSRIDIIESGVKQKRYDELLEYYNELCASYNPDFVNFIPMDRWNPHITLTATMTSLKKQAKDFIEATAQALTAIEDMPHSAEILAEYRQSLNLSAAISTVTARHKRIEEEKRRQEEAKAAREAREKAQRAEAVARQAAEEERQKERQAEERRIEEQRERQERQIEKDLLPMQEERQAEELQEEEMILAPPVIIKTSEDEVKTVGFKVTAPIWKLKELKKFLDDGGYEYE